MMSTSSQKAFVKSDRPARYPGLRVKYVRGADPVIKLMDEEERVQETLAIDKWNTDSVEEFLGLYLESAAEADEFDDNSISKEEL
ncbi:Selenoprotein F [Amphibalanus amphitrite]|uniref:Selenoprotein F n=1 Tax=Amphibalanus amphitrite TaxID=1232801 RepID=A0A6A4XD45_AMPAM|nr:Selenoprotein F [Amphibalanus amphitrite]